MTEYVAKTKAGEQRGPGPAAWLAGLVAAGQLGPGDEVRIEGHEQWHQAWRVPGLFPDDVVDKYRWDGEGRPRVERGWLFKLLRGVVIVIAAVPVGGLVLALLLLILIVWPVWVCLSLLRKAASYARFRSKLRRRSRVARWDEIERESSSMPGTLVLDGAGLDGRPMRLWWSPESAMAAGAPAPQDLASIIRRLPYSDTHVNGQRWLRDRYTHTESGRARLVDEAITSWGEQRLKKRVETLRASHPQFEIFGLWSWMLEDPTDAGKSWCPHCGFDRGRLEPWEPCPNSDCGLFLEGVQSGGPGGETVPAGLPSP